MIKAFELSFRSPVLFRRERTEYWKLPSDTILRGLVATAIRLYQEEQITKLFNEIKNKRIAASSLLLLKNNTVYYPNHGLKAYCTINQEDIIDASEITDTQEMVRISRLEAYESTPFEYFALRLEKYRGLILLKFPDTLDEIITASIRLLGDLGIGGKRSRGYGKFNILKIKNIEDYGLTTSTDGILVSRYIPEKAEYVKGQPIYVEDVIINFGNNILYKFSVIAEGSILNKADNGHVEYIKNDTGHLVPIIFTPLLIKLR